MLLAGILVWVPLKSNYHYCPISLNSVNVSGGLLEIVLMILKRQGCFSLIQRRRSVFGICGILGVSLGFHVQWSLSISIGGSHNHKWGRKKKGLRSSGWRLALLHQLKLWLTGRESTMAERGQANINCSLRASWWGLLFVPLTLLC